MTDTSTNAVSRFAPRRTGIDVAMRLSPIGDWVSYSDYAAISAQLTAANQRAEMLANSLTKARAEGKVEELRETAHTAYVECAKTRHVTLGIAASDAILALIPADTPAEPAQTVQDSFADLVASAIAEAEKAMRKFPQPNYVLLKVAEEAGEVVKAGVHFAEGRETRENVEAEMRQTIAMLYRLWVEGDEVNGIRAIAGGRDETLSD